MRPAAHGSGWLISTKGGWDQP